MKSRSIGVLAALAVVGLVAALFVTREPDTQLPKSGELLFPLLLEEVNDVQEMIVTTHEETVTLVKAQDHWGVKEKSSYPADMEKVTKAIVGLAEIRILEPKTQTPELYEKLGLQDTEQDGSLSTTLTLKSSDGAEAAKVIVGNQRPAKGNPRMSDIYVRKPGDPQTWLTVGNLPLEKTAKEWMNKEVTALPTKRVRQVTVTHPNGKSLKITKAQPEDLDFRLDSIPDGFKVASQFNVNNVAGTLVQLSLEDVKKDSEVDFQKDPGVSAVVETFDGFRLNVQTAKEGDRIFGTFSAEFDQNLIAPTTVADSAKEASTESQTQDTASPESPESKDEEKEEVSKPEVVLQKPEDVKKEVEAFNRRVKGWAYELPKFRVENFSKLKKDLLEKQTS